MKETNKTLSVLPSPSKKPTMYSKRDVAAKPKVTVGTKEVNKERMAKVQKRLKEKEQQLRAIKNQKT